MWIHMGSMNSLDLPIYRLLDCAGEVVQATFHEPELQLVIFVKSKAFKIEEIVSRNKKKGHKNMALAQWLGWPEKFNPWLPENDINDVW